MIDSNLKRFCLAFVFQGVTRVTRQHPDSFDNLEEAEKSANELVEKFGADYAFVVDQTIKPPNDMVVYVIKRHR